MRTNSCEFCHPRSTLAVAFIYVKLGKLCPLTYQQQPEVLWWTDQEEATPTTSNPQHRSDQPSPINGDLTLGLGKGIPNNWELVEWHKDSGWNPLYLKVTWLTLDWKQIRLGAQHKEGRAQKQEKLTTALRKSKGSPGYQDTSHCPQSCQKSPLIPSLPPDLLNNKNSTDQI